MDIDGYLISYLSERLKSDEKIALTAINSCSEAFDFLDCELKYDKEFIMEAIEVDPGIFEFCEDFHDDKEFIMEAIEIDEDPLFLLEFISAKLLDDKKIIEACIKKNADALDYASNRLKKDRFFNNFKNVKREFIKFYSDGSKRFNSILLSF